ncbi:BLOC-1 complex subunit 3 [Trinorchestia longiramus]|nr:BLOC-1 complex subunit 3 [Trinorchestia longiramus]
MNEHSIRKGIIVHGEDSESDDEMSVSELMHSESCKIHHQAVVASSQELSTSLSATSTPTSLLSATSTPTSLQSVTSTSTSSHSDQKSSSLLHQKLSESKKKLQSKIISTYLLPLERHQKTVQSLRGSSCQKSLLHANQSLMQTSTDLQRLDQLVSSLPSTFLQCLK